MKVQKLRPDAKLPQYMTPDSVGLDLSAALDEALVLAPRERKLVPTGIAVELPPGHEGQVRPRSGIASRHGVTCLNSPGTIDPDFRGELKVLLVNLGDQPVTIRSGERIAQLVVAPVTRVLVQEVVELSDTTRGAGGFGSTGT